MVRIIDGIFSAALLSLFFIVIFKYRTKEKLNAFAERELMKCTKNYRFFLLQYAVKKIINVNYTKFPFLIQSWIF